MPEQQPRVLANRYELRTPIGRGTMGTVWRAFDRSLGREIAVKEIRQDSGLNPVQRRELRERMLREGRMAARISHPSVATVHDAIEVSGRPWIIMELVEGRSLEQMVNEEGPLPPRMVAEIGYDLLDALRAAHAQGILHRDVKPSNVLLTMSGRVVLTDFGIAKAEGDSPLTQTGMVIGSPGYTAPERARGDYTGPESDLWSLGATLYFAVEGRPAYERDSVSATLNALMTETADPPTRAGPLRPILDGLLKKDYKARLSTDRAAVMLRIVADTPTAAAARGRAPREAPGSTGKPAPESGDADQTMLIIRPESPPPGSGAGPRDQAASDADEVTAPRRLPGRDRRAAAERATRGEQPTPGRPEADQERSGGRSHARLGSPDHPVAQHPNPPAGQSPHPLAGQDADQPTEQSPPRQRGLGTDLFSTRSPSPPDVAARIRVLILAAVAFIAFIVLVIVVMTAFGGR